MKIKTKILLFTLLPTTVMLAALQYFTLSYSISESKKNSRIIMESVSKEYANKIKAELEGAMDTARTLSQIFEGYEYLETNKRREEMTLQVKNVLAKNSHFFGMSTCWEPNALDGLDSRYRNAPGHDSTGRFIPYWSNVEGKLTLEPLTGYDKSGEGDWYLIPKETGEEIVTEPYEYTVLGKKVYMITLSSPIKSKSGEFLGVTTVDIDLSKFQEVYSAVRVYKTGFGRIVSPKGIVTTHPQTERIGKIWGEIKDGKADTIMERVKNGETFISLEYSEALKKYTTKAFSPVFVGKSKKPMLFTLVVPTNEIFEGSAKLTKRVGVAGFLCFIILIVLITINTRLIVKPILGINRMTRDISRGEGDLTKKIDYISKDEIGELSGYFNDFIEQLRNIVSELKKISSNAGNIGSNLAATSEETSATIEEISATIRSMDKRLETMKGEVENTSKLSNSISKFVENLDILIENQSSAVSESSASIEEMIASIASIEQTSEKKKKFADDLLVVARDGEESMKNTVVSIDEIAKSAETIFELIGVINNVSEQTDLLAMNAAIEAAHAGDAGKGFSVVADEIRKLAESTSVNAKDISKTLKVIVDNIKSTSKITNDTSDKMSGIISGINDISISMNEITGGMKEVGVGSRQITAALTNLVEISEEVKKSSNEVTKTIKEIDNSITNILNISNENHIGMTEISSGMSDIANSAVLLSDLGAENSANIEVLEETTNKFKI